MTSHRPPTFKPHGETTNRKWKLSGAGCLCYSGIARRSNIKVRIMSIKSRLSEYSDEKISPHSYASATQAAYPDVGCSRFREEYHGEPFGAGDRRGGYQP